MRFDLLLGHALLLGDAALLRIGRLRVAVLLRMGLLRMTLLGLLMLVASRILVVIRGSPLAARLFIGL